MLVFREEPEIRGNRNIKYASIFTHNSSVNMELTKRNPETKHSTIS